MPQYAKTRKGAPEGFEYVTAKPVKIGKVETIVGLGKSGAFKIATPQIDGATVTGKGKTFDDAINDLIRVMSPVVPADVLAEEFPDTETVINADSEETAPAENEPVKAPKVQAVQLTDTPLAALVIESDDTDTDTDIESEPVKDTAMTGPKLSALVMSAYRRSAAAVTAMNQRAFTPAETARVAEGATAEITSLCAEARESGVDGDKVERLRGYALRMVSHHHRLAGGDGERLTSGQLGRLRKKLGTVAKSLAA